MILLIAFLSGGCQQDNDSSISAAPGTAAPEIATEAAVPLTEQSAIRVPEGKAPTIDGALSPGEWDNAVVEIFSDGSELLLMHSEGYLYLGIRANTPEMIAGNVFIDRGDEIAILHVSAALGTALYERGEDAWYQTQAFVWRCRNTGFSEQAQAEREAFLEEEHWVSVNGRMGTPNELEYQIEISEETLRLAVNFIRGSAPDVKVHWPRDLEDDCILPTPGGLPEQLHLSPNTWAAVSVPHPGR
jgi:hypothetical protein